MRKLIFCLILCVFGITGLCLAQQEEKLTITTYYPSPTGVYQTLKVVQRADFNTGLNPGYDHLVIHGKDPGSSYGVLSFSANNTAGDVNIASIWGVIQSDTVGAESGGLVFATKSPADTMDNGARMFINASGYVGIGTGVLNPAAKLDIRTNVLDDGISLSDGDYFIKLLPGTTGTGSYNGLVKARDTALIFGNGTNPGSPGLPEALVIAPWAAANLGLRMDNNGMQFVGGQMELGERAIAGTTFANDTHMLRFWGKSGCASNALHEGGRIYGMMYGCNWMDAQLHLEAANNWDSWVANQLVLRGNGNVGIRTPEPYSRLHIANNVATLPITDYSQYQILLWNGTVAQASNSYGFGISSGTLWMNSNNMYRFLRGGTQTAMMINGTGVGIGTDTPGAKLDVNGNIHAAGYLSGNAGGSIAGGRLLDRSANNAFSVDWDGTKLHFYIEDYDVPSAQKTFIIDNPLDQLKYLIHATLEGPENAVFYRGEAQLNRGAVEIILPEYFEALTHEESRTVLLTPVFEGGDEKCSSLAASRVKNGRFSVKAIDESNPQQRFYWEVKAVRKDVPVLLVHPKKDDVDVYGDGPYKYYRHKK